MDECAESEAVMAGFRLFALCLILAAAVAVVPAFAQTSTGNLEIFLKTENGDRVFPQGVTVKIFQDLQKSPIHTATQLENNPFTVPLPLNHRYKVEVYMHDMYAGAGFADLKTAQDKLEITIKNQGGMRLNVFYKDGETPLASADIVVKSQDGNAWAFFETDTNGNTIRSWLYPTVKDTDYYYAEITIAKDIKYVTAPIRLQPNVAQEFKIVTNWPTIVDKLITVEVYNSTKNKVAKQDGQFVAELYDSKKNKVGASPVTDKGLAYFSNLKIGNYALHIKSKDASGMLQTVAAKRIPLTGEQDKFQIYLHNPELNADFLNCNCVAFRLDDVQDYFLAPAQIGVISSFAKKDTPLTIGVIGGLIGTDPNLVSTIKSGLASDDHSIEIASHSWNNKVLTTMTKAEQEKVIADTNSKIESVFDVVPNTFIPPENLFNNDTISVLRANGFTHMSSSVDTQDPPLFKKSDFYQFPILPYTARLNVTSGVWMPIPNEQILERIDESLLDYGYAVVMMHPYEFSMYENGFYVNKIDTARIQQLNMLIDQVKAKNLKTVTIDAIQDYDVSHTATSNKTETKPAPNCNCVAFRIDNAQDFWLNDVQNAVIDTFVDNRTPVTISVIGKFIGDDPKAVGAIKESMNKTTPVRIANRGWEYTDHSQYDLEKQVASIKQTNEKITKVFGTKTTIFSPPYDSFNKDTLSALQQAGLSYFSASTATDKPPYQNAPIKHVPSTGAFVSIIDDDPFLSGTIPQKALAKTKNGLNQYGFAVISLQPSDFAVKDVEFKNEVDQKKLGLLKSLLSDIKSSGMVVVPLDRIPGLLDDKSIVVPDWIKNNAGWWADGKISDSDFTKGLEYLIAQKIVQIPQSESTSGSGPQIPPWIKNNAKWWSEGQIENSDFVKGIQYLIQNGVIRV